MATRECAPLGESSVPALPVPLSGASEWRPAPRAPPRAPSPDMFQYLPHINSSSDSAAFRAVLFENQFPSAPRDCERMLIVPDDSIGAGLGYTARLLMTAVFVALKERRVLVSVPAKGNRWCARPPYTLNCIFEPWTHCTPPNQSAFDIRKWSHRVGWHKEIQDQPILRLSTSQVHKEPVFHKTRPLPELKAAALELLFRPRAWVVKAADCTMREYGLKPNNFVVLHVRHSASKAKERKGGLPPLSVYPLVAEEALSRFRTSHLFIQTSTPLGLGTMMNWSKSKGLHLAYTENARVLHDLWLVGSKQDRSGERASVVAQAVNAYVATRARAFISPGVSMWTNFVTGLMHEPASHLLARAVPTNVTHQLSEVTRQPTNHVHPIKLLTGENRTREKTGWRVRAARRAAQAKELEREKG